jgi:hypothetical protein
VKKTNRVAWGLAMLLAVLLVAGGFLLFQLSPYARREAEYARLKAEWLLACAIARLVRFVRWTLRI